MRHSLPALLVSSLHWCARHGRFFLILGLVLGIAFPALAVAFKPLIQPLIALLLFLSALRIGPRQLMGVTRDLGHSLYGVICLQLMLPLAAVSLFAAIGWSGILPTALVLMCSAAPISGSPNLSIMMGHDPAPALRLLTLGTALLPLTVLPVFWLAPALGGTGEVFAAAGKLLIVIAASVGFAFTARVIFLRNPSPAAIETVDGFSAIVMAAVVIGLMSAVGVAVVENPSVLAFNLGIAFAANFLLQIGVALVLRRLGQKRIAVPFGIAAGNRNIALFLTALPAGLTDPLLLFIGCYQVPMYLTPLLLDRFYRRDREPALPDSSSTPPCR